MGRRHGGVAVAVVAAGLAVTTVAPLRAAEPPPVELAVAPNGTGTTCSDAAPCALTDVQTRVRELNQTDDVTVLLADGTYPLTSPLHFGPTDGGRNGHRVEYRNAPGAHP